MILHHLGVSFQEAESVFLDFACGNGRSLTISSGILVLGEVIFLFSMESGPFPETSFSLRNINDFASFGGQFPGSGVRFLGFCMRKW